MPELEVLVDPVTHQPVLVDPAAPLPDVLVNPPGGLPGRDGLSAYQIAVQNGFDGTEQQWLASLHAEPGDPGSPQDLQQHVQSVSPHPVYDDGPSLLLLYQNVKV